MHMLSINSRICLTALLLFPLFASSQKVINSPGQRERVHHEAPDQAYRGAKPVQHAVSPAYRVSGTGFFTAQVNVDASGNNILGDAANEPSIAVDPVNPLNMAIGWRQFDDVNNNFRQAGYGYSTDGGVNWTFPGVIDPGVFRSDPVLDFSASGTFYYNSLTTVTGNYTTNVFKSTNGGSTWDAGVEAKGGDKQWMAVDVTDGVGGGNIYSCWNSAYSSCTPGFFTRSANAGASFEDCTTVDGFPYWGTMAVGPSGELFIAGVGSFNGALVVKSTNVQIPGSAITWNSLTQVDLDGYIVGSDPINPVGLLGQVNVDVDRSNGPGRGNVYVVASVARISEFDPADVMFARSTDGGFTFEAPKRLNTDIGTGNYQWMGTMSVAPNGRIDVIWLDTRETPATYMSALYYCYSDDQGVTWSINKKLSDTFDPSVGYPQQAKMGDYFDMVSDNAGAHLAWANTLNGEEDVCYTHIIPSIVGMDDNAEKPRGPAIACSPNPSRGQAVVRYSVPEYSFVRIEICNMLGNTLRTVFEGTQSAGIHSVGFSDDLPAGFYLCRMTAGDKSVTTPLVRLK